MASVTLTVLEGLERGRVFRKLHTPITIGREEVNSVQLNDERISRLHAKLQDDGGHVIFTDLNSTNGSRINGHPVQLRILRPGDHLQFGRCTLLYGSDEEIADRARQLGVNVDALQPMQAPQGRSLPAGGQAWSFLLDGHRGWRQRGNARASGAPLPGGEFGRS